MAAESGNNQHGQQGYPIQDGYSIQDGYRLAYAMPPAYPQSGNSQVPTPPSPDTKLETPLVDPQEPGRGQGVGEDGEVKGFDFTDKSIRRAFMKKVYALLMCQLLVTLSFISVFVYDKNVKSFVAQNSQAAGATVIGCGIASIVVIIVMACCEKARRTYPTNLIFLAIFTVLMSLPLGMASSFMDSELVMIAVGITAAICLGLTLFAFQTKWDFTMCGGFLVCFLMVLFSFGIIAAVSRIDIDKKAYASVGILLFSFYLVYDTQLMMGGGHRYTISPEEYIFAALNLYLDIINIFIRILRLLR